MITSPDINELAAALSKAQGEMDGAKKSATNPFFNSKYADLAAVKDAIREPFAKYGLSVVQVPQTTFSGTPEAYEWTAKRSGEVRYGVHVFTVVTVLTRLLHTSGQFLEESVSAMLPNGDPQSVGSAISYLRRYALQSVAGIAAADDDGETTARRPPIVMEKASIAASVTPSVTPNAPRSLLTQHPSGYLAWLDTLRAIAQTGMPALSRAWNEAPLPLRTHLTATNLALWTELRAIATRTIVPQTERAS
jgi:hypothetical protein